MESQLIGDKRLALIVQKSELAKYGINPAESRGEDYVALVDNTLRLSGIVTGGNVEIELFDGPENVMIFAEFDQAEMSAAVVFGEVEDLIEGIGVLGELPTTPQIKSSLTYYKSRYWIELAGPHKCVNSLLTQLCEFGHIKTMSPHIKEALQNRGVLLGCGDAIRTLHSAFFNRVK